MNFWLKKSWGKPNQWSCSSKKKFLTKTRLHELGLKVIMHKYIILNWVKTKVFSFIYVIDVQYYVNFRCQIAVYIYIHYKMITSLVSIYSIWNCYSIIDHIPCYINNCILMAYLFYNWRSVPLNLFQPFCFYPIPVHSCNHFCFVSILFVQDSEGQQFMLASTSWFFCSISSGVTEAASVTWQHD